VGIKAAFISLRSYMGIFTHAYFRWQ
jgi:hypothetical protein